MSEVQFPRDQKEDDDPWSDTDRDVAVRSVQCDLAGETTRGHTVAKKKSTTRRRTGARGPAGPPGPAGPAGPKVETAEILALVDEQFTQIRRQLEIQLRRMAQIQQQLDMQARQNAETQRQLDEVQSLVKGAVTQLQRTG